MLNPGIFDAWLKKVAHFTVSVTLDTFSFMIL